MSTITDDLRKAQDNWRSCAEYQAEIDVLQAELAEARAGGAHSCHANCSNPACKIRRERDSLRAELAQTRALLAVRTGALASIYNAKVVWPHASAYNMMDEREEGEARLSVLSKFIGDQNVKAFNALASDGTEELAAIKRAIEYLDDDDDPDQPKANALAALKKYFGGGGV